MDYKAVSWLELKWVKCSIILNRKWGARLGGNSAIKKLNKLEISTLQLICQSEGERPQGVFEKQRLPQVSVLWLQRSLEDTPEFNFLLISTCFSYLVLTVPHYIVFFWFEECSYRANRENTGDFFFPLKMMYLLLNNYKKTPKSNYINRWVWVSRKPDRQS